MKKVSRSKRQYHHCPTCPTPARCSPAQRSMCNLVGGFNPGIPTPLKNMTSTVGRMKFPTEWKIIKLMFQTTNQQQFDNRIESVMSWTLSCLSMKFVSIGRHHWIPGMQVDDGHRHVLRGLRGSGCDVVENALRHWLWRDEEKEFIAITTKGLHNCLQECLLPWPNDGHQTTHPWQLHGACKSYAFPKRFVDVQHFVIPAPHLFINNGTQAFLSRFATTTLKQWNTLEQSPQSWSEGHILVSCSFLHFIFGYILRKYLLYHMVTTCYRSVLFEHELYLSRLIFMSVALLTGTSLGHFNSRRCRQWTFQRSAFDSFSQFPSTLFIHFHKDVRLQTKQFLGWDIECFAPIWGVETRRPTICSHLL